MIKHGIDRVRVDKTKERPGDPPQGQEPRPMTACTPSQPLNPFLKKGSLKFIAERLSGVCKIFSQKSPYDDLGPHRQMVARYILWGREKGDRPPEAVARTAHRRMRRLMSRNYPGKILFQECKVAWWQGPLYGSWVIVVYRIVDPGRGGKWNKGVA